MNNYPLQKTHINDARNPYANSNSRQPKELGFPPAVALLQDSEHTVSVSFEYELCVWTESNAAVYASKGRSTISPLQRC